LTEWVGGVMLSEAEVEVEFLECFFEGLADFLGGERLCEVNGRGVDGVREVVELAGDGEEDGDGGAEVGAEDFLLAVGDGAIGGSGNGEPEDSAEFGGHGFVEDAFEFHHALVFVYEAEAVGEVVLEHAAVLADAIDPSLGASAGGGVVLDSGDDFVEGKGDLGELR